MVRAAGILMLVLICCLCAGCGGEAPLEVQSAPTIEAATVEPVIIAAPTQEPTALPTATADPLVGSYADEAGSFELVLNADGTYSIASDGQAAEGTYARSGDKLCFTSEGQTYECSFEQAGGSLILYQDGYEPLSLIKNP
ncbi:MAG: hypothetical protein Q4C01_04485 [Clostridia bacterium]|nr:hypothetical protein [Clostridia bacterium]